METVRKGTGWNVTMFIMCINLFRKQLEHFRWTLYCSYIRNRFMLYSYTVWQYSFTRLALSWENISLRCGNSGWSLATKPKKLNGAKENAVPTFAEWTMESATIKFVSIITWFFLALSCFYFNLIISVYDRKKVYTHLQKLQKRLQKPIDVC